MASREDWVRVTRVIQEAFSGIISSVGSARAMRRERRAKPRRIRLVSWAGRADSDTWFLSQLEQSKNRALIYYAKSQVR